MLIQVCKVPIKTPLGNRIPRVDNTQEEILGDVLLFWVRDEHLSLYVVLDWQYAWVMSRVKLIIPGIDPDKLSTTDGDDLWTIGAFVAISAD